MPEPTAHKTFKYKLRPTSEQVVQFEATLRLCRELYNAALQERKEAWHKCRVSVTYYQQKAQLPEIRQIREDCAAMHSQVLQDVILRVDRTFKAFFRRVKASEKPGYPRFKGRARYTSFTYPQWGNGASLVGDRLLLSKLGHIAVRWSRPLEGTPKTVTISKEADGWYACFSCAEVPIQPLPLTGQETGIDVGLESFLTLANGEQVASPRHYRQAEKALRRAQRRVSRRQKGSHRRRKAIRLLQRAHQKIARQRRDFQHKTTLPLLKRYDTVYYEALQVANMVQNHHLAKSISDAGWSQFCTILAFKAANAGKRAVAVPPSYTSQVCSGCGVVVQKGLSVRWHACPDCGTSLHRDHNAALNILRVGQTRQAST
ncbi:MAG TPA: transposase [Ktedonobacterales bacterium]|nr:transposase [Ktedonobacterales bacterium]